MVYLEKANTLSQKTPIFSPPSAKGYIKPTEQGTLSTCFKSPKALKTDDTENSAWSWWNLL